MDMKNRILKTIATSFLCITLVSNHFVAFAEDATPINEDIIEYQEEETSVEETIEEVEEIEEPVEEEIIEEIKETTEEENNEEVEEQVEEEEVVKEDIEPISETIEEVKGEITTSPEFNYSTTQDDMNVSIYAAEGTFPDGTSVNISVFDENAAISMAEKALGEGNVKTAKAVDITFFKDGIEIQPNGDVNVNISYETINSDDLTVLHNHDGVVEPISADVDKNSASFTSDEFSIFIIAEPGDDNYDDQREVATYKFYVYDSNSSSWIPFAGHEEQHIKSGDMLYNPGTPNIDPDKHEKFLGWYLKNSDGDFEEDPIEFDYIDEVTGNSEIKVYANIVTTYYVTFLGIGEDVVQVKEIPGTQGESAYTTVNDIPYSIQRSTQAFKGWTTTQNDESTLITNNSIDASQTSIVYAYVIDAYWIHFDENDDTYDAEGHKISSGGASYVGPVAVDQTKTPREAIPAIPESNRKGYDFVGWYYGTKNADNSVTLGDSFDWDTPMTEDVTVYAKWNAHTDTELTINIWKQNIDGTGYDYVADASHVYEGVTGARLECHEDSFYMSEPEGNYAYYSSSDVDLKGFKFSSAEIVDGSGNTVDTLSAKGDTVINVFYDRQMYTLTFQARNGNRWSTVYTINALYEQNISSHFPIKVGSTTYNNFWEVQGNPETYVHELLVGKIDIMPAENITFHRYTTQGWTFNATWNYYVETLEGNPKTTTYDDIDFTLRNAIVLSVTSGMSSTEAEEFMNIRGFTKYKADPAYDNTGVQPIVQNKPINLYYLRNRYTLTFMDGDTSLKTIGQIPYEQSLSSYEEEAPEMEDKDGTRFIGWYLDKSCTIPFNWNSTMPIDGQIVYAKYAPIRFRVTLNPNGGTIDTDKQAETFMEDYNGKLDANSFTLNISRENWELVGWFYEDGPKAGQAYDFDKITETTTDYTYDEEKGYFIGTVNLIAGWRFPGLVYIRYDAGEHGTDAPTADKYGYAYNSTVVVDRPSKPKKGYNFICWTIANDEDMILYPNSSFEIEPYYVEEEGDKNYITLVAVYEKIGGSESSTEKTSIIYHSNDGKNKKYTVKNIPINKGVPAATLAEAFGSSYSRKGYKFLGWSRDEEDEEAWLLAGQTYTIGADNDDEEGNHLYAVWEPAKHITYTDGVEDEKVFVDEVYEAYTDDPTPAFSKPESEILRTGWTFIGWDPEVEETVTDDATYEAMWEEDYTVTKTVEYTVQHKVNGTIKDTEKFTDEIWINDEDNEIQIQKDSLKPKTYTGYKFDTITPNVSEGMFVSNKTVITLNYIKNEEDTQEVKYTVNHIINDEIKDTETITQNIWIGDEPNAIIEEGSLDLNKYEGYKFSYIDPDVKEGDSIPSESVVNIYYEKDPTVTQDLTYTVKHIVDDEEQEDDTIIHTETVWINDPTTLTVIADDIVPLSYTGYKFDRIEPEDITAGSIVDNETEIELYYEPDESQTKTVSYTVNHILEGTIKKTTKFTDEIWILDEDNLITVTEESIEPIEYEGYEYIETIDAETGDEIFAEDEVPDKTVINIIYELQEINVRYEYRFADEDEEEPDELPELPDDFTVKVGERITFIPLPSIKGYHLTNWRAERDGEEEEDDDWDTFSVFSNTFGILSSVKTIKTSNGGVIAPAYDIVIYTVISKNKPQPKPDPKPEPKDEPTEIVDEPTPMAVTPITSTPVVYNVVQQLGARMGKTGDNIYKRPYIIIGSLAAIVLLLVISSIYKKDDEDKNE